MTVQLAHTVMPVFEGLSGELQHILCYQQLFEPTDLLVFPHMVKEQSLNIIRLKNEIYLTVNLLKLIRDFILRLLIRFLTKFFAIFTCHIFRNFATVWIKGGIFDIFGRGISPCCDHYFRWEAAFFRFRKSKLKITERRN